MSQLVHGLTCKLRDHVKALLNRHAFDWSLSLHISSRTRLQHNPRPQVCLLASGDTKQHYLLQKGKAATSLLQATYSSPVNLFLVFGQGHGRQQKPQANCFW